MKTRLLIIVAVFLVLIPWVRGLDFGINNEVMVDGITVSSVVVMTLAVAFSLVSWVLFSWASKNIRVAGIPLSVITATSLILPFSQTLGPMSAIPVGIVAGFASFMIQKKMICQSQNKSLVISAITLTLAYAALILLILAVSTDSTNQGIGDWTGTAEGMEETTFGSTINAHIEFGFFLMIIPSLMITVLIVQGKATRSKLLTSIGTVMTITGFAAIFSRSAYFLPPTEPPIMRPLEGIEYLVVVHSQAFLLIGIVGIFVLVAGVVLFWKEKTGRRDMRK